MPERSNVIRWETSNGDPDPVNRHAQQNGFPFPPEVVLGGFFLMSHLFSSGLSRKVSARSCPFVASIENTTAKFAVTHWVCGWWRERFGGHVAD
jgi:hypothetical protein